jgi:hypothetical protein
MADEEVVAEGRSPIPPYVAYKTFKSFLEGLKVSIPSRIDRSVMGSYSGAVQAQLLQSLKFFGLIGTNGHPKERLQQLVHSEGPGREKLLNELVRAGYPQLFTGDFDLMKATSGQLAEQFGASGETVRKCIAFLLPLLKDAGVSISPHIKGAPKRTNGTKRRRVVLLQETPAATAAPLPPAAAVGWSELLLSKFPSFDPAWPDDVKTRWFDSFEKLMQSGAGKPPGDKP